MDGYPKSNFQSGNILIRDSATPWPRLRQPRQRIVVGWILYKFIPILDIWTCQLQNPTGRKKTLGRLAGALGGPGPQALPGALGSSDELWGALGGRALGVSGQLLQFHNCLQIMPSQKIC